MSIGTDIAAAFSEADDVLRELFLNDQAIFILKGDRGQTKLAELSNGWFLDDKEHIEPPPSGVRYFNLFIEDPAGERLPVLKTMTAVRIGSELYSIYVKPSFLSAVPSYIFRVQAMGPQI